MKLPFLLLSLFTLLFPAFVPATRAQVAPAKPVVLTSPVSAFVIVGDPAEFSVSAEPANGLAYQWRKNKRAIAGATAAVYRIEATTLKDAGSYDVVVTNAAGRATSRPAKLTVKPEARPYITSQPASGILAVGTSPVLTVTAVSRDPVAYQWRLNGQPIEGQTGDYLVLPDITTETSGRYDVLVTNALGTTTSKPAFVRVRMVPPTPFPVGTVIRIQGIQKDGPTTLDITQAFEVTGAGTLALVENRYTSDDPEYGDFTASPAELEFHNAHSTITLSAFRVLGLQKFSLTIKQRYDDGENTATGTVAVTGAVQSYASGAYEGPGRMVENTKGRSAGVAYTGRAVTVGDVLIVFPAEDADVAPAP